MVKVAMLM